MHHHQLHVLAEGPHWKASACTSILACCTNHINFQDLATASHVFLWHGALQGALQVLYVNPYRVLHRGNKTYTTEVQGAARQSPLTT